MPQARLFEVCTILYTAHLLTMKNMRTKSLFYFTTQKRYMYKMNIGLFIIG